MGFKFTVERREAFPDEFDATVGALAQRIENIGVENEHWHHGAAGFERMVQRGVVVQAQVAAQPNQCGIEFRHGARKRWQQAKL